MSTKVDRTAPVSMIVSGFMSVSRQNSLTILERRSGYTIGMGFVNDSRTNPIPIMSVNPASVDHADIGARRRRITPISA
jgi:hypothetical protein